MFQVISFLLCHFFNLKTSVKRQKGESQNGGNKKGKHVKFSEKRTFLIVWYVRVGKVVFPKIWRVLLSSYLRFEIRPFALLKLVSDIFTL